MDKSAKIMWGLFWLVALFALSYFFQDKIEKKFNPNQRLDSQAQHGRISVVLEQNAQGHYVLSGTINQQPVTFLLDTGATQVAIPAHLASTLGLRAGREQRVSTANGTIGVKATTIKQLTFGAITLNNLKGHLNPGMSDNTILLGMNALKQLELVQRNNTLTITQ